MHVIARFDSPVSVACTDCKTLFSLAESVAHIRRFNTGDPEHKAFVLMPYGRASHFDEVTHDRRYAVPDLDFYLDIPGDITAPEWLPDLLDSAIEDLAEQRVLPPTPRHIDHLKSQYPDYSEWEWVADWLPVTRCLVAVVAP